MKKYSKDGYKRNSKDKNNPYNIIPSSNITMKDVDFPVHGTDNLGNSQIMMPGGEYVFPGNEVFEVPLQNLPRHFQKLPKAQRGRETKKERKAREAREAREVAAKLKALEEQNKRLHQELLDNQEPVTINTLPIRPIRISPNPIPSDYVLENPDLNPMNITPRNYIEDRVDYWTDPNSLARSRMEGDYLEEDFISPYEWDDGTDDYRDYMLDDIYYADQDNFDEAKNQFINNLSNIAFVDMTEDQKRAQKILEEFAEKGEDPWDMVRNYEDYGYETLEDLFDARYDIEKFARMAVYGSDSQYEPSSQTASFTVGQKEADEHAYDIKLYNKYTDLAKKEIKYKEGDKLDQKVIDKVLREHGEDPSDPKWKEVRAVITMNPDMHKISSDMTEEDYNTTLAHEISHVGRADHLSSRDRRILQLFNRSEDNLDEEDVTDHHLNKEETYSDLMAVRQDMLDKGIYDYRIEQMTDAHWQDYLGQYEEGKYPLTLQRMLERYRVPDAENPDQNIQYINNAIAMENEISDDTSDDIAYAKYGGSLPKFQTQGSVENLDLYGTTVNSPLSEKEDPGNYPEPDPNELFISEDAKKNYEIEKSIIENKVLQLQQELQAVRNEKFLNDAINKRDAYYDELTRMPSETIQQVAGRTYNLDLINKRTEEFSKLPSTEELNIQQEIEKLINEFDNEITKKYIKEEYLLPPDNSNSFYHDHYLKIEEFRQAEHNAYYGDQAYLYHLDGSMKQGHFLTAETRTSSEIQQQDDYRENIYANYEPNPMVVGYEKYWKWKDDPEWGWNNLGIDIHSNQVRPKSIVPPTMYGAYASAPGFSGMIQSGNTAGMNNFHAARMNETQMALLFALPVKIPLLNTMKFKNPWNLGYGYAANKTMTIPGAFDYTLKGIGAGLNWVKPGTTTGIKNVLGTGSWSGVYKSPQGNLTLKSQVGKDPFKLVSPVGGSSGTFSGPLNKRLYTGDFKLNPNLSRPGNISPDNWNFLNKQQFNFNPNISASNLRLPGSNINTGQNLLGTQNISTSVANPLLLGTGIKLQSSVQHPLVQQSVGNRTVDWETHEWSDIGAKGEPLYKNTGNLFGTDLPSVGDNVLQLKSLQNPKIQTDKNGYVKRSVLQSFINKASKKDKVVLEQMFNSPGYVGLEKINLNQFRSDVSNSIIPFNKVVNQTHDKDWVPTGSSARHIDYGYENIGYVEGMTPVDGSSPSVLNKVVVSLQNPQQLGTGDTHLGTGVDKYNLAWFRGNFNKDLPGVFTGMEFQSNWAAHGPRGNPRNEIQDMIVFQKMPKDWINPATGKIGTEKEFYETYRDASLSQVQEKIDMTMWEINYHEEQLKNFLGGGIYIMDPNGSRRILDASNMSKAEFETQLINLDQQVLKNLNHELGIHTQNYEILQNQNLDIKKLLSQDDAMYHRVFGESVLWAAQNGATTYRFPTVQTAATFQGYSTTGGTSLDWNEFQNMIDLDNNYLYSQIFDGSHIVPGMVPSATTSDFHTFNNIVEGTGGIRLEAHLREQYYDVDPHGNIIMKPDFVTKYTESRLKLKQEIKDLEESRKLGETEGPFADRFKLSDEQREMMFDKRYQMYKGDESLFTGSHQRWEDEMAIINQNEYYNDNGMWRHKETGEIFGPATHAQRPTSWSEPWRENLYQEQIRLGRQLTKDEVIEFGFRDDFVDGKIYGYNSGGRSWATNTRANNLTLRNQQELDMLDNYKDFASGEKHALKVLQDQYQELYNQPRLKLEEYRTSTAQALDLKTEDLRTSFYKEWYNPIELHIPNIPATRLGYAPTEYTIYNAQNSNEIGGDQLLNYWESYRSATTLDANDISSYESVYHPILQRHQAMPKWAQQQFGVSAKNGTLVKVTDAYGNEYWEFVIPKSVYDGTYQLQPWKKFGGQVYQQGGENSYIKGSSQDPNIYPDQEFTWYNPMDWYRDYTSISPEEVLANARKEGYESWYSVLPKHLQNTNYYDLKGAYEAGLDPIWEDEYDEYHMGSRDPISGKLFKYEDHPTFDKLVQGETDAGNVIYYDDKGQFYSDKEVPEGMHAFDQYTDQYFLEYLQHVENSYKRGFQTDRGVWLPFRGEDSQGKKEKFYTIGYGHTLSKEDYKLYKKGVSQEVVDEWLQEDIADAQKKLDIRYGKNPWYQDLHAREKAILLDIEYNVKGGMNSFPQLQKALETGNKTLLLTEFWRELPGGKKNQRNVEFFERFVRPVSNMYKYNKKEFGGEIKQDSPRWGKRRNRLKQQLKLYQEGGSISPFARAELLNLGLIKQKLEDLIHPSDKTKVVNSEISTNTLLRNAGSLEPTKYEEILDNEMNLTPKSYDDQEYALNARSDEDDEDDEEIIDDEDDDDTDDDYTGTDDTDTDDTDDTDTDDDDTDDDDDDKKGTKRSNTEGIEIPDNESYVKKGSSYEKRKHFLDDDDWVEKDSSYVKSSRPKVKQPRVKSPKIKSDNTSTIKEYKVPLPKDFTSELLAREFVGANYAERPQSLSFEYLKNTYGDYLPRVNERQEAKHGGELPKAQDGIPKGSTSAFPQMEIKPEDKKDLKSGFENLKKYAELNEENGMLEALNGTLKGKYNPIFKKLGFYKPRIAKIRKYDSDLDETVEEDYPYTIYDELRNSWGIEPTVTFTSAGGLGVGDRWNFPFSDILGIGFETDVDLTGPGWGGLTRNKKAPGWTYAGVEMAGNLPAPFIGTTVGMHDIENFGNWLDLPRNQPKLHFTEGVEQAMGPFLAGWNLKEKLDMTNPFTKRRFKFHNPFSGAASGAGPLEHTKSLLTKGKFAEGFNLIPEIKTPQYLKNLSKYVPEHIMSLKGGNAATMVEAQELAKKTGMPLLQAIKEVSGKWEIGKHLTPLGLMKDNIISRLASGVDKFGTKIFGNKGPAAWVPNSVKDLVGKVKIPYGHWLGKAMTPISAGLMAKDIWDLGMGALHQPGTPLNKMSPGPLYANYTPSQAYDRLIEDWESGSNRYVEGMDKDEWEKGFTEAKKQWSRDYGDLYRAEQYGAFPWRKMRKADKRQGKHEAIMTLMNQRYDELYFEKYGEQDDSYTPDDDLLEEAENWAKKNVKRSDWKKQQGGSLPKAQDGDGYSLFPNVGKYINQGENWVKDKVSGVVDTLRSDDFHTGTQNLMIGATNILPGGIIANTAIDTYKDPSSSVGSNFLDNSQDALQIAGNFPGHGEIFDVMNAGIDYGRAYFEDDPQKKLDYQKSAAVNLESTINPFAGAAATIDRFYDTDTQQYVSMAANDPKYQDVGISTEDQLASVEEDPVEEIKYGGSLPKVQDGEEVGDNFMDVFMNEYANQSYNQNRNMMYVHPEDVEGPQVPFIGEHEPDHVLRHELEHYYQWQDLKDDPYPSMAPLASTNYDIVNDMAYYDHQEDNPMSKRIVDDKKMVMREMYLKVLDPDGTDFWMQNLSLEELMEQTAFDNESIYQLERQVMNYPANIRDYMLDQIRGERANRLNWQAGEEVYNDPRTLEGQARMIEDDPRHDAHVIETLKHIARKNQEEGKYENPNFTKELKTLTREQYGGSLRLRDFTN